eukprot:c5377_g1_i1.p1 GENE.c5377_g1_i1~~c5377_g1_i1.p1  ORF type:complete len:177 (+),score=40.99 c5377_g1_i1:167-697(+)
MAANGVQAGEAPEGENGAVVQGKFIHWTKEWHSSRFERFSNSPQVPPPTTSPVNKRAAPKKPTFTVKRVKCSEGESRQAAVDPNSLSLAELQLLILSREQEIAKLTSLVQRQKTSDLDVIASLTVKWRRAAQQALQELFQKQPRSDQPLTFTQFIERLQVDPTLVHFSIEEEDFVD